MSRLGGGGNALLNGGKQRVATGNEGLSQQGKGIGEGEGDARKKKAEEEVAAAAATDAAKAIGKADIDGMDLKEVSLDSDGALLANGGKEGEEDGMGEDNLLVDVVVFWMRPCQ